MTTVSALPTLPERGNPATFNALFEGFLAALKNNFVGEVNLVAGEINAAALTAVSAVAQALFSTSTTSLTLQTGAASLTIEPGKLFAPGQYIMVISTASPAAWMYGTVDSYNTATGVLGVTVTDASGAGALASWRVSVAGIKGAPGGVTLSGVETLSNKTLALVKTIGFAGEYDNGSSGAAKTVTLAAAQKQKITLSANTTLTLDFTGATVGTYQLRLIQDATGGRTVTWSGLSATRWLSSTSAPPINGVANRESILSVYYDGTTATQSLVKVGAA